MEYFYFVAAAIAAATTGTIRKRLLKHKELNHGSVTDSSTLIRISRKGYKVEVRNKGRLTIGQRKRPSHTRWLRD